MSRYPELDADEVAALQAFANAHGRKWKSELSNVYWYNARLWRGPTENTGSILHGIRNNYGPTWLYDVCTIKPAQKVKPLRLSVRKATDCPGYYVYGGGRYLSLHPTSAAAYEAIQQRTMATAAARQPKG